MLEKIFVNPVYRKHRESLVSLLDLTIVTASFTLALLFILLLNNDIVDQLSVKRVLIACVVTLIIFFISFRLFKVQKSLWKYISTIEVIRIAGAVLFSCILIYMFLLFMHVDKIWVAYEIMAGALTFISMLGFRVVYRSYRRISVIGEMGENVRRAVIIGAGDAGYLLSKELIQNKSLRAKVIGFIDDKRKNLIISGIPVLGTVVDLEGVKERYRIDLALIAIPSASKEEINRIVTVCKDLDLEVKIMREDSLFVDQKGQQRVSVDDISIEDLLGRGQVEFETEQVKSYIERKTVMVTGAAGSIGSELCRQIVKFNPRTLILLDINENGLYMLEQEFNRNRQHNRLNPNIEFISIIASIRDKSSLDEILQMYKVEVVYHAAAHKHVPLMETRPMEAIKNNVFGTKNLIHSCIEKKVERLIMISTDKAVNPTNVMGATKRVTEMLLQANGNNGITKMAAVRFGNVLGSNGSVIPIFKQQIKESGPITITDKKIKRYFMTIPEASQLVLQAGYYADKGEIFVLDMGDPVYIIDLAEKMIRLAGLKPYTDIDIIEIGLRPGEKMYEELVLDGEESVKTGNKMINMNKTMQINYEKLYEFVEVKLPQLITDKKYEILKKELQEFIRDE